MWFATHIYISVFKISINLFLIFNYVKTVNLNAGRQRKMFNKLILLLIILVDTMVFLISPTIFSVLSVNYSKAMWDLFCWCGEVKRHVLIFYTIIYYHYAEYTDELQLDDLQVAG
jgi:hypothetical protein